MSGGRNWISNSSSTQHEEGGTGGEGRSGCDSTTREGPWSPRDWGKGIPSTRELKTKLHILKFLVGLVALLLGKRKNSFFILLPLPELVTFAHATN